MEETLLSAVGAGLPDPLNLEKRRIVEIIGWSQRRVGIGGVVVGALFQVLDQIFQGACVTISIPAPIAVAVTGATDGLVVARDHLFLDVILLHAQTDVLILQIEAFPIFPVRYLISISISRCDMDTGLAFDDQQWYFIPQTPKRYWV